MQLGKSIAVFRIEQQRIPNFRLTISGQIWTLTLLSHIFQAKELEAGEEFSQDAFWGKLPFMETEWFNGERGADKFAQLEPPRFLKIHLPYELWKIQLVKHPDLKIIQTIRNPEDTLVSYYHHLSSDCQLGGFKGSWDQFFELFQQKKLPWGDYFEQNAKWYKFNMNRKISLVLIYEEMHKDPKAHVAKIVNFIDHDISEKAVDLIVKTPLWKRSHPSSRKCLYFSLHGM